MKPTPWSQKPHTYNIVTRLCFHRFHFAHLHTRPPAPPPNQKSSPHMGPTTAILVLSFSFCPPPLCFKKYLLSFALNASRILSSHYLWVHHCLDNLKGDHSRRRWDMFPRPCKRAAFVSFIFFAFSYSYVCFFVAAIIWWLQLDWLNFEEWACPSIFAVDVWLKIRCQFWKPHRKLHGCFFDFSNIKISSFD